MSRLTRAIRLVRHWHARIGVLLALFLLFLAATGLALNHSHDLGLDKCQVKAAWLMRWYGLKSDVPQAGFLFSDGYLAAVDGRWVMNGKTLGEPELAPVGATAWGGMRALANADTLYLYMADGRLVDKLADGALPGKPVRRVGLAGDRLALEVSQGVFVTEDGSTWQPAGNNDVPAWSAMQPLPATASKDLATAFAPALSLERILLDLHSGRLFGRYGPQVMDAVAIILVLLVLSGGWIYLRTFRRAHHTPH